MTQAKIFLTGATGNVGTELVKQLAATGVPFKALVRDGAEDTMLSRLPQATLITGDLADEAFLVRALEGVDKAFLLTNSSERAEQLQLNFVQAAHKAGVRQLVKLSQFAASEQSPVRFLRYHARVEQRIKELGFDYTFLRPNLFMQGLIAFRDYITGEGKFYAAAGDAAISAVDVRDIAAVAARTLTEAGHEHKIYNITGAAAITHTQMAAVLSEVLGRKIEFINVNPEQMQGALTAAGFPEWQVEGLIEDYAHYARGEASVVDGAVRKITGRAPRSFRQFVADHKALFQ